VLEDPVAAALARDRRRRIEDAVVVAGGGVEALAATGAHRREVRSREEVVDGAGLKRERLLLLPPVAARLLGAEGDVGDVVEAVAGGVGLAGGDGDAIHGADRDPSLDGVRVARGIRRHGSARQLDDRT
jgi:hypothetical protein